MASVARRWDGDDRGTGVAAGDWIAAGVGRLRAALDVPVETYDERFTTALAGRVAGRAEEDARAAAHLLEGFLARREAT